MQQLQQQPLPLQRIQNCPGKRIQDYVFVKELGKGAFGQVFSAKNVNTQELVAIKCVPRVRLTEHGGIVGELLNSEVQVLQQIHNEHVVRLITYLESANQCYIVMEFCNSGDFEQLWKSRNKKIPEDEAIDYMKQVLAGMQALHEKNVLHRDLKLANILIHNQILKIADLGFCKQLENENQTERLSLGSLGNMAPEVVQQQPYGMSADMFSIGSIFYQLLYGQFPFTNIDQKSFLNDIKTNKPDFRKNDIKISPQLQELIERMLKYDPKQRLSWTELYQHPLMQQKDKKLAPLSINLLAGELDTQKMQNFYNQQQQKENVQVQNQQEYFSKLNNSLHQEPKKISILSEQKIVEEESQFPTMQQQQVVKQLEIQADLQIKQEKQIQEYLEKYMRLRDPIVYISRTLNSINIQIPQEESVFICLLMSKKLLSIVQNLVNLLLNKVNIFNTDLLDKIYQNQYFHKFRDQIFDDMSCYQNIVQIMFTDVEKFNDKLLRYVQNTWIREIQSIEPSNYFKQIYSEAIIDFVFKLTEKRDKEKDLQLQEKYLEIQILLLYCIRFEQLNNILPVNIHTEFDELSKLPVQTKLEKFNNILLLVI